MKFSCDNCQAQYMISDEKVGPAGVRVRCKKCSHVIFVQPPDTAQVPDDATVVMSMEKMAQLGARSPPPELAPSPLSADPTEDRTVIGAAPVEGPPAGLDDEIGQALDSMFSDGPATPAAAPVPAPSGGSRPPVVLGASPLSGNPAASANPFGSPGSGQTAAAGEQLETRQAKGSETARAVGGAASGLSGAEKPVEWFIAVRDEQVGPLQVGDIKSRFEKGEVGSDTLVWSTGLSDWRPLSTVEELAEQILPKRDLTRVSRIPIPAEATKEPPKKEPIAFRPSGASALASLASMAQEEIRASEKPSASPPRFVESQARDSVRTPEAMPAQFLAGLPSASETPDARSVRAPGPHPGADPVGSVPSYRESPLAQSKPRRRGLQPVTIAAIALGVALVLGGLAFATYAFVIRPQRDLEARLEQQQREEAQHQAALDKARQEALAQAAKAPTPVPPPAEAPAPQAARPAALTPPPPQAVAQARQESHEKRGVKHGKGSKEPVPQAVTTAAPPAPPPEKAGGGKSDDFLAAGDVDKEFAKELDGSGESAKASAKHAPYIPPPPGQGDLPAALSQSDIVGAVAQHRDAFAKCVQDQKRRDPSSSGTVVMRWRIKPDGRSVDVAAKGDDYADSPLAACFKGQIGKLRFGAYRGPQMAPIEFPFSF